TPLRGVTDDETEILPVPVRLRRAGREIRMVVDGTDPFAVAKPDARLIRLLLRARRFNAPLAQGEGVPFTALAQQERVSRSYFTRLLRLSYLAPDITQAILDGRQPSYLTAEKLLEHSRLPPAWHEQPIVLGFAGAQSGFKDLPYVKLGPTSLGPAWQSRHHISLTAVLEFGPTEILPPIGAISKNPSVSADPIAKPAAQTRAESRVLDLRKRLRERDRLSAGGRWIRTSGSAPAATPLTDRGVKPQATAAGCHFGEILPQGATLMMALSVSFSRNWRERSTDPRTGKGAYRGMVT